MADNNDTETFEESITSLDLMRQEQESAHPTDTPATTDLVYAQRGTGSDRNRVWTLSEIFALFATGSISELIIPAQGGRAVLNGKKLKFETVDGGGEPTGNKAEFAYNGGISFIESEIAKASLTKQGDGSYELKLHDGMASFGDGVSTDGTTLKAVPRVLVNKKVNEYDPIERRCTLAPIYGVVAVVREVNELSSWHVEQTILTPGKLEVWSTKGNAEEDYTLHKVNELILDAWSDMLFVSGESDKEWMLGSKWYPGQVRKVMCTANTTINFTVPAYDGSATTQQITFKPSKYREFICTGKYTESGTGTTYARLAQDSGY